jgi:hypothetical protein
VLQIDTYFMTNSGCKHHCQTTKGWYFNSQSTWSFLKDLKESNPVQVAEYCVTVCIDQELILAWWAHYTLKKKQQNKSTVNHKFAHFFNNLQLYTHKNKHIINNINNKDNKGNKENSNNSNNCNNCNNNNR